MKSTVKVSISRSAFHLDSDAYDVLHGYLEKLGKYFEHKEGGKEIVSDIEERLAELLTARIAAPEQVITASMVDEVIRIMGMPDDMDDGGENSDAADDDASFLSAQNKKRRLYRDTDNRILGGVCSGLAAYFNQDIAFWRLCFVLLVPAIHFIASAFIFGQHRVQSAVVLSFITYFISWIVIPPIRHRVTITDIQRNVEDKINTARQKWEKQGKVWTSGMEEELLAIETRYKDSLLVRGFKLLLRLVAMAVGIVLLITAVGGLIVALTLLSKIYIVWGMSLFSLLDYVVIGMNFTLLKLLLILVLFLPLLGLAYIGVKAFIGFRDKFKIGATMFLLWLAAFATLAITSISSIIAFHPPHVDETAHLYLPAQYDTLYINIPDEYKNINQTIYTPHSTGVFTIASWTADAGDAQRELLFPAIIITDSEGADSMKIASFQIGISELTPFADDTLRKYSAHDMLCGAQLTLHPFAHKQTNLLNNSITVICMSIPKGKTVKLLYNNYVGKCVDAPPPQEARD
ncbi:MAG: PspC domain-containing protein [Prevotellaceae bacterium]|jgi:phage shock protein PspC (stress-responsive transcriptional regulator)|nr:PspC domain-containing protein [Prevotellaceae bacterium]